jgi:hypothetical protein
MTSKWCSFRVRPTASSLALVLHSLIRFGIILCVVGRASSQLLSAAARSLPPALPSISGAAISGVSGPSNPFFHPVFAPAHVHSIAPPPPPPPSTAATARAPTPTAAHSTPANSSAITSANPVPPTRTTPALEAAVSAIATPTARDEARTRLRLLQQRAEVLASAVLSHTQGVHQILTPQSITPASAAAARPNQPPQTSSDAAERQLQQSAVPAASSNPAAALPLAARDERSLEDYTRELTRLMAEIGNLRRQLE